jgi:hypothetical protein
MLMATLVTTKDHAANKPQAATHDRATSGWRSIYRIGAVAAAAVLALVPVQAAVFIVWPPPTTVGGFFSQFEQNAIVGLLALDLLLMASWILSALMFVALYAALRRTRESLVTVALIAELVGLAVYFASNTAFSMLTLSQQYAAATTDAERSLFLAAGQAMLALYTGTAFNVSYLLSGVAALLMASAMLRSGIFGRVTAYIGIAYAVLQVVPPTAGDAGMIVSLLSLAPMVIWIALIARTLFRLGGEEESAV